jgi:hypothetical protein
LFNTENIDVKIVILFIIFTFSVTTEVMLPEIAFYVDRDGKLFFSSTAVKFGPANGHVSLQWNFAQEKIFLSVLLKGR